MRVWQFTYNPALDTSDSKVTWRRGLIPVLEVGCCGVEWWLLFCDVRSVISWLLLHDCPHFPQLSLLNWSPCHLSLHGGPILSLWSLCFLPSPLQQVTSCDCNHFPLTFPALNLRSHGTEPQASSCYCQLWLSFLTFGKWACKMSLMLSSWRWDGKL